ncbi:MAG: ECF transporter S component [Oscillospiraceae bacterium]
MSKKTFIYIILFFLIPVFIIAGSIIFKDKQSSWIILCVTICAIIPFFLTFEKGKSSIKEMIIIAVMVSIGVLGRMIIPIPGFKPVTAIIIITAMYFGSEMGFITGALTAFISNFWFGQGPWTPFQMFVWGLIGFVAGMIAKQLKSSKILLIIYGAFSGVVFSLFMDIWTVLWWDNSFNFARYITAVISSSSFIFIYAISNIIFLLIFVEPIGSKLERIKNKYGF